PQSPRPALGGSRSQVRQREVIAAGGSSLRDFRQADGELGYFQHRFDVYGREGQGCRRAGCGGVVVRKVQSGRSSFYCPSCQR
ncbi:MAG: zinc finger domain-containing protein, partial [Pseudomonadota bacterium]